LFWDILLVGTLTSQADFWIFQGYDYVWDIPGISFEVFWGIPGPWDIKIPIPEKSGMGYPRLMKDIPKSENLELDIQNMSSAHT
jgi:hypothetical protein